MNISLSDPKVIVAIVAAILIIAMVALLYMRKRKKTTADLHQKFGPEYERAVLEHG